MHIVSLFLFIGSAILLIGAAIVGLVHDLAGRGPHDAPMLDDDGLDRPSRYHSSSGTPPESAPAPLRADMKACNGRR